MFLAPLRSDLGESLLITTLLGIPLGEPNRKIPTAGAHRGAHRQQSTEEFDDIFKLRLPVISAGTTFIFSFWICMANNQGGFNKHLVNPKGSGGINGDLQP